MNFKKGDIISNGNLEGDHLQWVQLLDDMYLNTSKYYEDSEFRDEYPYKANVVHVKGIYKGQTAHGYVISRNSFLIKSSNELFNRIIKPFKLI